MQKSQFYTCKTACFYRLDSPEKKPVMNLSVLIKIRAGESKRGVKCHKEIKTQSNCDFALTSLRSTLAKCQFTRFDVADAKSTRQHMIIAITKARNKTTKATTAAAEPIEQRSKYSLLCV